MFFSSLALAAEAIRVKAHEDLPLLLPAPVAEVEIPRAIAPGLDATFRSDGLVASMITSNGARCLITYEGTQARSLQVFSGQEKPVVLHRQADGGWQSEDRASSGKRVACQWLERLAECYVSTAQEERAEAVCRNILSHSKSMRSEDHLPSFSESCRSWISACDGARKLLKHLLGTDLAKDYRVQAHVALGHSLDRQKKPDLAQQQYECGIETLSEAGGPNHRLVSVLHDDLAVFCSSIGEEKRAEGHRYLAGETRRVSKFAAEVAAEKDQFAPAAAILSRLPGGFRMKVQKGDLDIAFRDANEILNAIPGFQVPQALRSSVSRLQGIQVKGNNVTLPGEVGFSCPLGPTLPDANITLSNASFNIQVTQGKPSVLELTNIKGMNISSLGLTARPENIRFEVRENGVRMRIALAGTQNEPKSRIGRNVFDLAGAVAKNAVESGLSGRTIEHEIPLQANSVEQLHAAFGTAQPIFSGSGTLWDAVLPKLGSQSKEVRQVLSSISGIELSSGAIDLQFAQKNALSAGTLTLNLAQKVHLSTNTSGGGLGLENISGVSFSLPLAVPQELKAMGIDPGSEQTSNIRSVNLSPADKDGQRWASLRTDGSLSELRVQVDRKGTPVPGADGRWPIFLSVKNPLADDQGLSLALLFKGKELAMSKQELLRMGSRISHHSADLSPEGVFFFATGNALNLAASAIDTAEVVEEVGDSLKRSAQGLSPKVKSGASLLSQSAGNFLRVVSPF